MNHCPKMLKSVISFFQTVLRRQRQWQKQSSGSRTSSGTPPFEPQCFTTPSAKAVFGTSQPAPIHVHEAVTKPTTMFLTISCQKLAVCQSDVVLFSDTRCDICIGNGPRLAHDVPPPRLQDLQTWDYDPPMSCLHFFTCK